MTAFNFTGFISKIMGNYAAKMERAVGATVDYFAATALLEPNAKGNMKWDAEYHYFLNNQLNGLWQAMYGNTTDTVGLDMAPEAMPRDTAWKPVHVHTRADGALSTYKSRRTYCDDTNEQFSPEAAANDPTFLRLAAEEERTQFLFDMFKDEFDAKKELYESLFETAWVYKPYTINTEGRSTNGGEQTEAQKAFAAKLRAMKNRNTGEAEDHTRAA